MPHGKPNSMLHLPMLHGGRSLLTKFTVEEINHASDGNYTDRELLPFLLDIYASVCNIIGDQNIPFPTKDSDLTCYDNVPTFNISNCIKCYESIYQSFIFLLFLYSCTTTVFICNNFSFNFHEI